MNNLEKIHRELITKAKRIVVKVGTHTLVNKNGVPNKQRIAAISSEIAGLRKKGYEVILVSSGAIGAGLQTLGMKKRPTALNELQMAAAVGQLKLLNYYNNYFSKKRCHISQVLLTHADLKDRKRHLNARNTLLSLLAHEIVPIINENDVVADDEIKIGDNDLLSALVVELIDADLLIMLTTPNGLRETTTTGKTKRIAYLEAVDRAAFSLVKEKEVSLSTGGMGSKLQAAQTAAKVGALVVIAPGGVKNVITGVVAGNDIGTLIGNREAISKLSKRKKWISYFHRSKGKIIIDAGAASAIRNQGKSLLPIGVKEISGKFMIGDLVDIVNQAGELIAQGLIEYSSDELKKITGARTSEIQKILGYNNSNTAIHRDNLVVKE